MSQDPPSDLSATLRACRGAFAAIAVLSGVVNLLTLTGSIFMLAVYDRVLPSHSVPTLVGIGILAMAAYSLMAFIEAVRARVLSRIGFTMEESLNLRVFDLVVRLPLRQQGSRDNLIPLRDLDQIRSFLSSPGPTALFDMPWLPIYLGICFMFHPAIGWTVAAGAVVLLGLTVITELVTRRPVKLAGEMNNARSTLLQRGQRNAEAITAMGMTTAIARRWAVLEGGFIRQQMQAADVSTTLAVISRTTRMMLQSIVLAVGAYLVIMREASGGVMIASSILSARALAPIELAIAHWRGFQSARQSWHRLNRVMQAFPAEPSRMSLPPPSRILTVANLGIAPAGTQRLVLSNVSFELAAGTALGVIGPSASGKSTLGRALVGVWPPAQGSIRLDGATLDQWSTDELGVHIGYLPQEVELLSGTIAENISRFDAEASSADIFEAAVSAGVHEMIVSMPNGYKTEIGEDGSALSGGQRQRIGLARALYKNPFLLVLDEPNSNLDSDGETALNRAITRFRDRGSIVIVIAHKLSLLGGVDKILFLRQGKMQAFGPRDDILSAVLQPSAPTPGQGRVDHAGGRAEREAMTDAG